MSRYDILEGQNEMIRSLLIMKYDAKKTLTENIIEQKNAFKPEDTFGKCINQLTFTPISLGIDNPNDSITKKINKWAKSIGESFSFELYRRSGWGSNRFDKIFTKCGPGKLSVGKSFQDDLDRYKRDKSTLQNAPYFCFNQSAIQNKWDVPKDNETGVPNYMFSLSQNFGTYDSCKILSLLNELPKFDWDRADKEDWKNIFMGLSIGLGLVGGGASLLGYEGTMLTFLFYGSIVADMGEAAAEYAMGDYYDAGLTLAFSLIPFLEIPGVKKYSKSFMKNLHKKVLEAKVLGKYTKLSTVEKEALNNIIKNKDKIVKASIKYWKNTIAENLSFKISQGGLKTLLKVFNTLSKLSKWKNKHPLKTFVLTVGGTYLTYDQLSKIYNITNKQEREDKIKKINESLNSEESINEVKTVIKDLLPDDGITEMDGQLIDYIDSL